MVNLINRLRTGTHEQAVGLLLEVQEAVKPELILSDQSMREGVLAWAKWMDWKAAFDALLRIGTPEACVGAAMMLMPKHLRVVTMTEELDRSGWLIVLRDTLADEKLPTASASTLSLALAAAIMETRNG